jgi:hypothetical protein
MRIAVKGLGVLALAAVCCSMANADAYAGGEGYSGTYLVSGTGADVALSFYGSYLATGVYASSFGSSYDWSTAWTDGYSANGTLGYSFAYPELGASYDFAKETSTNYFTVTNSSPTDYEYAALSLSASGSAAAYSDGNGYGYGWGGGALVNLSTGDEFIAEDTAFSGLNEMGVNEYYFYSSLGGFSLASYSFSLYSPDSYVWGGASWSGDMWVLLAPGQTDLIATEAASEHEAYSTTPAPAAIAPFALGLLGALRRSKRA